MNHPRFSVERANHPRLMILCSTTGYQTHAFAAAAEAIGAAVLFGSDRCHVLDDPWRDGALPLRFERPDDSAQQIAAAASSQRIDGMVALGDRPVSTAARACELLGLPFHPPIAADICRDKYRSRERLSAAGFNIPCFERFPVEADPRDIVSGPGPKAGFPCVLKPLALSGSRGVIRADNPEEFVRCFLRLRRLLRSREVRVMREETSAEIQVEAYVEGIEVAVEGIVDHGNAIVLAIFDKPDPLEGPFFEETIYVTPSRLAARAQRKIIETVRRAVAALGLFHGPFHAELRINLKGVWPLEVAGRSIGGLCARTLRFLTPTLGETVPLEQVLIALALGKNIHPVRREQLAAGVMMIPIEKGGVLQSVDGLDDARSVAGIEDVVMTTRTGERLVPFPEGCSYPGFIFARANSPESVEQALRRAHTRLRFNVTPDLPVVEA